MSKQPTLTFVSLAIGAQRAGLSKRQFRRLIEDDGVPVIKIGRYSKVFIREPDFAAWKAKREGLR